MPTPLIPWETCNVPSEIQSELNRRKTNRSFDYRKIDGWNQNGGDWEKYKGPMTSWVRVCSNGLGRPEIGKPGFVLTGGKSFYQTYGFQKSNGTNQQVLGYTPDGREHTLDYDMQTSQFPIHVPSPEITRVETVMQKELFRRATIHWTCFSLKQLEYMTPYFLVPRMTVIVEFGWNHFNPESLIDLTNKEKLVDYYFNNPYPLYNTNILQSNGNYDVVFGLVSNFEWSIEGNKINCTTEITSKDRLYAGVPISTIVAEKVNPKDPKTDVKYFSNIRQLCATDFIKNLKSISSADSLEAISETASNQQLLQLIKGGKKKSPAMKKEYWRGIFYGRDDKNMGQSGKLDFKWTPSQNNDLDINQSDENVWVNMGFLVELMNRTLALPSGHKDSGFFEINVDESVIGAHPNLISCDGRSLLIPNAYAPKYMWGKTGKAQNGTSGDYSNQKIISGGKVDKLNKDKNDPLWHANAQLTTIFDQGNDTARDDLDNVINAHRYLYPTERSFYAFPFITEEEIVIKNRKTKAKYDAYFYGYFKDLYFNVKKFIDLVNDTNIKTYADLYKAIFDEINKAGGNFWEFALVTNENTSQLVVADNRMAPSGNNKSEPWYFDCMDADQIMQSLSFKPKMSDPQAMKAIFGETNNSGTRTVIKSENDLLDYKFYDAILSTKKEDETPTVTSNPDPKKDPFEGQIKNLQHIIPKDGSYQFTVMVDGKPYIRRLAMPDSQILNCILDDEDFDQNQKYTGIQPITVEVGLQGIGGIRTFMSFLIRNVPNPYHHNDVAYRIVDVSHSLQDGKWETTIKAGIQPLRGWIRKRLGIAD
jgi:hypothetical protein